MFRKQNRNSDSFRDWKQMRCIQPKRPREPLLEPIFPIDIRFQHGRDWENRDKAEKQTRDGR